MFHGCFPGQKILAPQRARRRAAVAAANDDDVTTRPMRDLAAVAGTEPATFTRLAKTLGCAGWEELRAALTQARRPSAASPLSDRAVSRRHGVCCEVALIAAKLKADAACAACISADSIANAAKALHRARKIWIAGFRSCRSVAALLNDELRLFRADTVQLVGGSGPEDLDLGAFVASEAVVVIGFAPYLRASVLSAHAARRSGARLITIADSARARMAEGADHLLLYEAAALPGFFPSLTGAIAIAQSLAAVMLSLGGEDARKKLRQTEARLAATSQYVAGKG